MLRRNHWRVSASVGVLASALALTVPALAAPAFAAGAVPLAGSATATGPVSPKPASGTPYLAKTKSEQAISQVVQCGGTMYAVGRIWHVLQDGQTYWRDNAFSFSATAPYTMTNWAPQVTGRVHSIAFVGGNCADAYIGGSFSSVNGTSATNIAEISTTTGAVVSSFGHDANGDVDTLLGYEGHLLAGGKFTGVNGSSRKYFESLNPSTGKDDGFVNLNISGAVRGFPTLIYNQQLSHGGTLDLVEGNFTSVGGQSRQQIFMLNLAGSTAKVTAWTSPEFNQHCRTIEAFYVRSAAWSPDDSTIYTGDTGEHLINWTGTFPLTGPCDAVVSLPATQKTVSPNWIEYSGCDSYYSVAADDGAVYAAGHPRWADNPNGCNQAGPGAVKDHGLQGLNLANGKVLTYPDGTPRYTMSRANADSMLITSAGLWIGSTNRGGSNACVGVSDHSGICLLPYPG
jgi:hypothetical protein